VAVRLIGLLGLMMITSLVVVPAMVRAQHRLPQQHDLGHHDPIPQRLRYNWNGETAAKVKPAPPDERDIISPLPAPTAFSVSPGHLPSDHHRRDVDERIPASRDDRSPLFFRGPPALLS